MTTASQPTDPPTTDLASAAPSADVPIRVLVVDDDQVDRMAVRRGLRRAGGAIVIDEAEGSVDALEMLAGAHYDCVFLDFNIPGGNGLTLLRRMRERGVGSPVVMLTGQGDEQVAVELMKAGAVDYMPKSAASPERLTSSLRYAVELSRAAADMRQAQQDLRASVERARFLAEASAALASSLDVRTTLERVAQLAVPLLGDYCLIYLLGEDGLARAVTSAHADPEKAELARAIERRYRPTLEHRTSMISEVIRTGTTQLMASVPAEHLASIATSAEEAVAYRTLNPATALFAPLTSRTTLGAICFCRSAKQPSYSEAEVGLAEDLARRAATALDNSMLYDEAQRARARTERLQAVTARLAAVIPRAEVVGLFASEVRDALEADTAWISLLSEDRTELVAAAHIGFVSEQVEYFARVPVETPMPARDSVRDAGARWYASKVELLDCYPALAVPIADIEQEGLGVVPLTAGEVVLGVITIGYRAPHHFHADERALATALAQQCAQALERARLYEAERASRDAAEEANRAKSEFLARMSHDLRTPLNAIGGYAQLIEEGVYGVTTEAQRQSLERIRRAQKHLLMLINDILSFAKLEAGQVNMTLVPVGVRDLVHELRPLVDPQAAARELHLELLARDGTVQVVADRGRLAQILVNLLTNAVKFTEPGGTVEVSCEARDGTVVIRVRDTGSGIPAGRLEAIFDPFIQVSGSNDPTREGVGLGLAISRELAHLMNGELTAESEVGVGSVFALTLPRHV